MLYRVIACTHTHTHTHTHIHTHVSLFGTNCPIKFLSCIRRYRANIVRNVATYISHLLVQTQHTKLLAMKAYLILENTIFLVSAYREGQPQRGYCGNEKENRISFSRQCDTSFGLYSLLSCAACQSSAFGVKKEKTDLFHTIDCFCDLRQFALTNVVVIKKV